MQSPVLGVIVDLCENLKVCISAYVYVHVCVYAVCVCTFVDGL